MSQELPLAGVKVLDLTRLLPGNFATLLLSGLGAEVIKVEEPRGGDGTRHMHITGPDNESAGHVVLNRGKQSLAIDLKNPQGREAMLALVATADVLIDSFRPGVLDRLGLGEEALAETNPTLVHVSITAFGPDGDYRKLPAHDLNSVGYAGALSFVAGAGGHPPVPGLQNADMASGLHAALAVVSGLRAAERDEMAFRADVAMADAAATLLPLQVAHYASRNESQPVPDMLTGALACYDIYTCADGKWLTVGGLEPKFFARMVTLMGCEEFAARQYDRAGQSALHDELADVFATKTRDEWMDLLSLEDTCVGPVLSIAEALVERNFVRRGTVTTAAYQDGSEVPVFKSVPWIDTPDVALKAPRLGENGRSVLSAAGLSEEAIDDLIADGIVGASS